MKLEEAIKTTRFVSEQHKVTINILYTANWLKTNMSSALKAEDITGEQFNVLRILNGKHPELMCVKDIGSRMIERSSNVPRIIDKLVDKRLAKRTTSKEDKRETLVSLTEKGINLLDRAKVHVDAITEELTRLTDEEATQLNFLLEKMREQI